MVDEDRLRRIIREELRAYEIRRKVPPDLSEKRRAASRSRWGETVAGSRSTRLALARRRGTHTEKEWFGMLEVHDYRCVSCGVEGVVKDHIIPVHQPNSSDGIDNIQPLCRRCNPRKGRERADLRQPDWREKLDAWLKQNASKTFDIIPDGTTTYIRSTATEKKKNASKTHAKEKSQDEEKSPGAQAFLRYAAAFKLRYETWPVRNAKVNSLLAQLAKRLGAETPDVAEFYLTLEEPLYVRSTHAVDLLVRDAEKIRTAWATGKPGGNGQPRRKPGGSIGPGSRRRATSLDWTGTRSDRRNIGRW